MNHKAPSRKASRRAERWIREPAKRLPIAADYDVVVVGGGIAGVAAVLAAARSGVRAALVEKECSLGGIATLANVVIYLPLCDGMGRQVVRGIGEELLKLSIRDGSDRVPACWMRGGARAERLKHRYRVRFNPATFMLALEERVLRAGADILYDTRFCDVARRNGRISAIIVENKSGRAAIRCNAVVDASGDADVCARAGEETVALSGNVAAGWFFYCSGPEIRLEKLSRAFDSYGRRPPDGAPGYGGHDPRDVTRHMIETRELIRARLRELTRSMAPAPVFPLSLPAIPSFRMTRRLKGAVELDEEHERVMFPDSIGMTGDWRRPGPVYYIPFRSLAAVRTGNLVTAGRCISAAGAWDVTRAIPACAVTGQAAGAAAALLCAERAESFSQLSVRALQARLRKQGALVLKSVPALPAGGG